MARSVNIFKLLFFFRTGYPEHALPPPLSPTRAASFPAPLTYLIQEPASSKPVPRKRWISSCKWRIISRWTTSTQNSCPLRRSCRLRPLTEPCWSIRHGSSSFHVFRTLPSRMKSTGATTNNSAPPSPPGHETTFPDSACPSSSPHSSESICCISCSQRFRITSSLTTP